MYRAIQLPCFQWKLLHSKVYDAYFKCFSPEIKCFEVENTSKRQWKLKKKNVLFPNTVVKYFL